MQTKRRRYRVRFDRLDELLSALGHTTEVEKAAFVGVAFSTWYRLLSGKHEPSEVFMGAVQDAFPKIPFEELFERVDVETAVA